MTFFVMYMSHEDECFRKILQQYLQYRIIVFFFSYSCGGERRDEQFIGCTDGFTEYICSYCSVIEFKIPKRPCMFHCMQCKAATCSTHDISCMCIMPATACSHGSRARG